jgi:hypothetical protein
MPEKFLRPVRDDVTLFISPMEWDIQHCSLFMKEDLTKHDLLSSDIWKHLKDQETKTPNQAPQTTTRTVTDRAPSSTLRASASRV